MTEIKLEYVLIASKKILYERISTPTGLAEWFADSVKRDDKIFTFCWDDYKEQAKLTASKRNKYVKFSWLDKDKKYFQFEIQKHNLGKELSLIITDFAESESDAEDLKILWNKQINRLKTKIGIPKI